MLKGNNAIVYEFSPSIPQIVPFYLPEFVGLFPLAK